MIPKKDSELVTEEELRERALSIRRQWDKLENTELRDNSISAFERKHEKIVKLHNRLDAINRRIKEMVHNQPKGAGNNEKLSCVF